MSLIKQTHKFFYFCFNIPTFNFLTWVLMWSIVFFIWISTYPCICLWVDVCGVREGETTSWEKEEKQKNKSNNSCRKSLGCNTLR